MRKLKLLKIFSVILSLMLVFNTLFARAATADDTHSIDDSSIVLPNEPISSDTRSFTMSGASMGRFYSNYSMAGTYIQDGDDEEMGIDNSLQHRANCYGYAFRFFYAPINMNLNDGTTAYRQRPGEFGNKTTPLNIEYELDSFEYIYNREDLNELYTEHFSNPDLTNTYRMNILDQLLKADASTLGYTVTEYTGTTIPDAQNYSDRRLIAVVVDEEPYYFYDETTGMIFPYTIVDYHFYMQHSDNTWSHKPGTTAPQRTCIDNHTQLTNDNIREHACEGIYDNGELRFYYITKDAVCDYRHLDGTSSVLKSTTINNQDTAGNYIFAAQDIGTLPEDYINGNIDYVGDIDYYVFEAENSGTRTITISSFNQLGLYVKIHDQNGNVITSLLSTGGSSNLTVNLTASQKYYLSFYCPNQVNYVYNQLSYSFW